MTTPPELTLEELLQPELPRMRLTVSEICQRYRISKKVYGRAIAPNCDRLQIFGNASGHYVDDVERALEADEEDQRNLPKRGRAYKRRLAAA